MNTEIKILRLDPSERDYSEQIFRLYLFEGWAREGDDSSKITAALKNSRAAFGAFDGEKMVGFFRALSDGVSDAYLLDLIVDPQYRGRGIASALVKSVLDYLKAEKIEWIVCVSTPAAEGVYKKFGASIMAGHVPMRFV